MIYFTSDLHIGHSNILIYDKRPFASVEEMNESLVANWNATVTDEDTVYFLGDFSMSDQIARIYMPKLNGKIIWVCGNHDPVFPRTGKKAKKREEHLQFFFKNSKVVSVSVGPVCIQHNGVSIKMSHFPYHNEYADARYAEYYPRRGKEELLLHGHVHISHKRKDNMINVGCMHWDYKPVSIDKLLEYWRSDEDTNPTL
jgi:calcineurin-like phosphoesterase family protein